MGLLIILTAPMLLLLMKIVFGQMKQTLMMVTLALTPLQPLRAGRPPIELLLRGLTPLEVARPFGKCRVEFMGGQVQARRGEHGLIFPPVTVRLGRGQEYKLLRSLY